MVHYVLGKRKLSLDQMRKGLELLNVLSQIKEHPSLYAKIFTAQDEYTNDEVISLLQFDNSDDAICIGNFKEYIKRATFDTLQKFISYVSGSTFLPRKKIVVSFSTRSGFFGGTCTFKIECPIIRNSEEFFCALDSILIPSKAHFTSV